MPVQSDMEIVDNETEMLLRSRRQDRTTMHATMG